MKTAFFDQNTDHKLFSAVLAQYDTIKKDSSYLFRFSQTADLSQFNRKYDFLIYHTFNQDMSHINDSLLSEVQNNTGLINHTEEFEQNMAYCQSHLSTLIM